MVAPFHLFHQCTNLHKKVAGNWLEFVIYIWCSSAE